MPSCVVLRIVVLPLWGAEEGLARTLSARVLEVVVLAGVRVVLANVVEVLVLGLLWASL
jgi:hypothetical protein